MPLLQFFSYICFAMLALMSCISCQNQSSTSIPEQLVGIWKNSDTRYAECYLEFSKKLVTFGTVDNGTITYYVRKVESEKSKDNSMFYTIHYKNRERETEILNLTYNADPAPSIQLKNQREVWQLSESKDIK